MRKIDIWAARLCAWLKRVRHSDGIVIANHGAPIAGRLDLTTAGTLERLTADGIISRPTAAQRPTASGRDRPRPRRPLADIVGEQRR